MIHTAPSHITPLHVPNTCTCMLTILSYHLAAQHGPSAAGARARSSCSVCILWSQSIPSHIYHPISSRLLPHTPLTTVYSAWLARAATARTVYVLIAMPKPQPRTHTAAHGRGDAHTRTTRCQSSPPTALIQAPHHHRDTPLHPSPHLTAPPTPRTRRQQATSGVCMQARATDPQHPRTAQRRHPPSHVRGARQPPHRC